MIIELNENRIKMADIIMLAGCKGTIVCKAIKCFKELKTNTDHPQNGCPVTPVTLEKVNKEHPWIRRNSEQSV